MPIVVYVDNIMVRLIAFGWEHAGASELKSWNLDSLPNGMAYRNASPFMRILANLRHLS